MIHEKLLIVEDDYDIQHLLQLYFEKEFHLFFSDNGLEAYKLYLETSPDLIILDIMLPGIDGIEVCKRIRKDDAHVPIIFLSSKSEYDDRIEGLETGADDYIIKPFDPGEIVARVKAHLRRVHLHQSSSEDVQNIKQIGNLTINMNDYSIYKDGEPIQLFTKEKQLIFFLMNAPNRVFSIEQLYDHIWGEDKFGDFHTVKVHISNIRRKIEKDPSNPIYIQTVRGFGYKFNLKNF